MATIKKPKKLKSALKFPCDFPIKVIGLAEAELENIILELFRQHFPDLSENALSNRSSKDNKYLSITVTVRARSQKQLDKIYMELTAHEKVIMVL